MGNKRINIYNDASSTDVIYYHKRFLFNLGKKKCSESEELYDQSLAIPFNVLRGPDATNKRLLKELIESLPENYETKSGFRMKVCDIQNATNVANIDKVEEYLESKWGKTFNLPRISIKKKSLKSLRSRKGSVSRARSVTRRSKSKSRNTGTVKKSRKLTRRHSY